MKVSSTVISIFNCSLERAFKTPILGDATKFLIGYGVIPPIIGFADDATWGKPGGHRIPLSNGNIWIPKGEMCNDKVLSRDENKYWKWEISDFKTWSFFFAAKAQGQLFFNDNKDGTINVKWTYTYFSKNILYHPFTWIFTKIFWKGLQKKAIKAMKQFAEDKSAFVYS